MSNDMRKIMENARAGFTQVDVERIVDIYRKGMWQYGEPFVSKFPQLDDDVLSDAIAEYITEVNGEYDYDLYRELYEIIQKKYTIFG